MMEVPVFDAFYLSENQNGRMRLLIIEMEVRDGKERAGRLAEMLAFFPFLLLENYRQFWP